MQKAIQYPNPVPATEPKWAQVLGQALDGKAMGYAYRVAKNGVVVAQGQHGYARAPQDAPKTDFMQTTPINLASVSKSVTAVAVLKLLHDKQKSVGDDFYPFIKGKVPTVATGVDKVTIGDLLTMKSGMVAPPNEGPLSGDLWPYLNTYLQQPMATGATPGVTYAYSNTNFTILQALVEELSGVDYVTYVTQNVLAPMGISASNFSPTPANVALDYASASDTQPGQAWGTFTFVAPGGWVATPEALMKFLIGVRNNTVLDPQTTLSMLNGEEGWYTYDGIFGQYFHHNGGLGNGATPSQGVATGIIRLADGYDAAAAGQLARAGRDQPDDPGLRDALSNGRLAGRSPSYRPRPHGPCDTVRRGLRSLLPHGRRSARSRHRLRAHPASSPRPPPPRHLPASLRTRRRPQQGRTARADAALRPLGDRQGRARPRGDGRGGRGDRHPRRGRGRPDARPRRSRSHPTLRVHPLRIAPEVREGATVYLAARLRKGAPPGTWLFPGSNIGTTANGTLGVLFEDPEIHLPGTSGAPVVDEAGDLVGMVVRFREVENGKVGLLPAPADEIRRQLLAAPPPAAPKKGLWAKLFG